MSGLFGGGGSKPIVNETPRISALRIQTSCYGAAIPVVIGRQRCTGNLLYYGDLQAIRHEQSQSSGGGGGGKGGGGGVTSTSVTYTYRYSMQVGICEGPANVGEIWMQQGSDKIKLSQNPQYGYSIYPGDTPNGYSSVLAGRHSGMFFNYPGLCNFTAVDLGEFDGDTPPSFSFEVTGVAYDASIGGADPAQAIQQIITNARWGAAAPAARFPVATAYGDYAVAMGWSLGLELSEQKQAADWVQNILDQTNAAPVWAADHLEIVPYGDQAVSGNGRTWSPNVTPIYDLTDDDFLGDPAEPVRVTRKADSETANIQPIEFRNRANEYNIEATEGSDPASVAMFGPKKSKDTLKAHGITDASAAARLANIKVQRQIRTRNEYEFTLPWSFCRLLPMDIVTLTDASLGLDRYPVRLTRVVDTADMEVQCTAEDFPAGAGHAALIPRQPGSGYNRDYNAAPGNAATPVIFEPPVALAGRPEIWIGSAGGSDWGGANVLISLDGASYKSIGRLPGKARMGVTTSALPQVADPDSTSTIGVNLSISGGSLVGVSDADRDAFATLSYVGGELIAYKNASLTGANAYTVSSLRRGAYGTPIASHASGSAFVRCDDNLLKYPYDPDLIGKTIYVKLQSFNLFGGGEQDVSTLTPINYTIQGAPMGSVSGLALAQPWVGQDCLIKWNAAKSANSYAVEVWVGGVKKRTVTGIGSTSFAYTYAMNKADGGPYRSLEFRLYAIAPNGASSTASVLTASNDQMAAPSGLLISGNGPVLSVLCDKPATPDYAGTKVWIYATSGMNPLAMTPDFDGPTWAFETVSKAPGRWYVRVAHYDVFGSDSLNISSEVAVDYIGAIGGIPQVANAAALTTLASPSHWAVYDLTTKKIWRWNAATSSYTKSADGGDLNAGSVTADRLAVAQLSAIASDIGDITAGRVHSPSGAVDLDLLNKTLTVKDPMGQERAKLGMLPSGDYGVKVTSPDGSKTAVLTPNVGTIIARGIANMPATLNADNTYGVDVALGGTFNYADLDVFLNPINTYDNTLIGNMMVDHSWVWQSYGTIYRFNALLDPGGTYKERDTNDPTTGRFRFKAHGCSTGSNDHAILTNGIVCRTDNGSLTSGNTIRLLAAKFITVADRLNGVVRNMVEIGWPLGLQYTIVARNYQG